MEEYINREVLFKRLDDFTEWCKDERRKGVDFVLDCVLPNIDNADVVPSSEVEKANLIIKQLNDQIKMLNDQIEKAKQEVAKEIFEFLIQKKQSLMERQDLIKASVEFFDFIDDFIELTGEEILAELKKYIGE